MNKSKQKSKSGQKTKVIAPTAVTQRAKKLSGNASGNHFRVVRSELVGTVTNGATTGFAVTPASLAVNGYDLSATSSVMFPWLSSVAVHFERYKFHRLTIRLISSQPTTATGRVYIAFDPDWDDAVPITKGVLMGLAQAVDASVFGDVVFKVDLSMVNTMPWRYCNQLGSRGGSEPRMSYGGFFTCAVDTPTANLVWDMWVDYDVELSEPTSENVAEAWAANAESPVGIADGGKWYWYPTISGLAGTSTANVLPTSAVGIHAPGGLGYAIDISKTAVVKYTEQASKAGVTPGASCTACTPQINFGCYDARGVHLGWCDPVQHTLTTMGSSTAAGLVAVGGNLRLQMTLMIADVLVLYAAAKYLVPMVSFAANPDFDVRNSYFEVGPSIV